jgi:hypothetical protein
MSELGQTQKSADVTVTSALPRSTDIVGLIAQIRLVPNTDMRADLNKPLTSELQCNL